MILSIRRINMSLFCSFFLYIPLYLYFQTNKLLGYMTGQAKSIGLENKTLHKQANTTTMQW